MYTNNMWSNLGVTGTKLPAFQTTLFDNTPNSKAAYTFFTDSQNRLKSKGSIQSILEVSPLMYRSLRLLSPRLMFSPDFPDYLLNVDDPKCVNDPPEMPGYENLRMPHHRNDLFERFYHEYDEAGDENEKLGLTTVPTPTITWSIVRSEPGSVGGEPFSGTREVKPRNREFIAVFNPELQKYIGDTSKDFIKLYGGLGQFVKLDAQVFDNIVQYNCWARTSWEVEELTEWFIDYLRDYTGMYREAGIVQMWFDRRVRDDTMMAINNKYHLRSFLYYFRTERVNIKTIEPIRRIETSLRVETLTEDNKYDSDYFVVNDFHDKLLERYHQSDIT